MQLSFSEFRSRVWFILASVSLLGLIGYMLMQGGNVVLLFLFAVILAVGFTAFAQTITDKTKIPYGLALPIALLTMALGLAVFVSYFFPALVNELTSSEQLIQNISTQVEKIATAIPGIDPTNISLDFASIVQNIQANSSSIFSGIQNVFSQTTSAVFNVLIVLVVSIFLAAQPSYYKRGLIALAPKRYQPLAKTNIELAFASSKKWLLSLLVSMGVIAILTYVGLLLLGIPLAFSLAIAAGLLSFIPNLGPILSFIPALLVSLTLGVFSIVAVSILYIAIQVLESNLITPKIEQKLVDSPPALLIFSQLLLGTIWGFLGLLLAAPAVAVGISLWKNGSWEIKKE